MKNFIDKVKQYLYGTYLDKQRDWTRKIVASSYDFIGGKLGDIKKIAKYIVREGMADEFIKERDTSCYEIIIMRGFVIAYDEVDITITLSRLDTYLDDVDNWSCVDSICSAMKGRGDSYKEYLEDALKSSNIWHIRYGIVGLLNDFSPANLENSLKMIVNVSTHSYYIDMAIAWAISVAYVIDDIITCRVLDGRYGYLKGIGTKPLNSDENIDKMILSYAVHKVKDSYRVTTKKKEIFSERYLIK